MTKFDRSYFQVLLSIWTQYPSVIHKLPKKEGECCVHSLYSLSEIYNKDNSLNLRWMMDFLLSIQVGFFKDREILPESFQFIVKAEMEMGSGRLQENFVVSTVVTCEVETVYFTQRVVNLHALGEVVFIMRTERKNINSSGEVVALESPTRDYLLAQRADIMKASKQVEES